VKSVTTAADGKTTTVESDAPAALVSEISAYAKAQGYTPAQAQALMDRELKLINDADVADKKAQADGIAALKKTWQDQTRADKDFAGADGTQFDANMAQAKRALTKFFPEVAKDADKHPFLDHPQVLKGLLNIGKLIGPDGEFITGRAQDTPRDPAKIMFPGMA
jgi:hypothetical protein